MHLLNLSISHISQGRTDSPQEAINAYKVCLTEKDVLPLADPFQAWSLYTCSHWNRELEIWDSMRTVTDNVLDLLSINSPANALLAADALSDVMSENPGFVQAEQESRIVSFLNQAQQGLEQTDADEILPLRKLLSSIAKNGIDQMIQDPHNSKYRGMLGKS